MSDRSRDSRPASRPLLSSIDSLVDALSAERRLLEELIAVMRRQRSAVGDDDLQSVDDSVFATHRVLVTLNEARRRRRSLNSLNGLVEDIGIHALEEALGPRMTPALREARDELQNAARALSHEVSVNRRILRTALADDVAYPRTLASDEKSPAYATQPTPTHVRSQSKKRRRI
jgi:hypothetical protein